MDAPFPAMGRVMKHASLFAEFGCLAVAVIWGSGFIASQLAIDAGLSAPGHHGAALLHRRSPDARGLPAPLKAAAPRRSCLRRPGGIFFIRRVLHTDREPAIHHRFPLRLSHRGQRGDRSFLVWALGGRRPTLRTLGLVCGVLAGIGLLTLKPGEGLSFNLGMALPCWVRCCLLCTSLTWAPA